jgi:hypothetical protein
MEFELDDYRSGRINKKVRNLNCINSTGYNNTNENKYKKKKLKINQKISLIKIIMKKLYM